MTSQTYLQAMCLKWVAGNLETQFLRITFDPFHATGFFPYPLKIIENQKFSGVFRMYRKRPVTWHGLINWGSSFLYNKFLHNNLLAHWRPMFPIIQKPVNWLAKQINWLVSIWWGTLVVNELKLPELITFHLNPF